MADQIVLSWVVDVTGTSFGPTQAAVALVSVPLYNNPITDPVLGQMFGLTVASDVSAALGPSTAGRTLTLNMTSIPGAPFAPPPFPCRPRTTTPPVLPYPLRRAVTLPGSFFLITGLLGAETSKTQVPSLSIGDKVQFLAQEGVFYEITAVNATAIGFTPAYTGVAGNSEGFKEVAAPVAFDRLAVFSTSDLDTIGVATVPPIPAGSGARTVELVYNDSTGAGPFLAVADLTGRRPATFTFDVVPGIDIAEIVQFAVSSTGAFANSVGEITLVSLSDALPAIPPNATPGTGIGAGQGDRTFFALTDAAQLLIDRHLVYMPPSYFALAQQGTSAPQLAGDFIVTTNSTNVPTTEDQTGVLAPGSIIRFAEQQYIPYTVSTVTPKIVILTTAFTGIDNNNTGTNKVGTNADAGTQGNIGTEIIKKRTGAFLVDPSPAAPPSNDQLSGPLAQFVALETAGPPPFPPGAPATVPVPTFLSGLFTRQLQLALAGVPVVPQPITFV